MILIIEGSLNNLLVDYLGPNVGHQHRVGVAWNGSIKLDQVVSAGKYFKKHSEDTTD